MATEAAVDDDVSLAVEPTQHALEDRPHMRTITVRADREVERALAELTEAGRSQSAVIREAILAAYRERQAERLRAEAQALAADPDDLAEVRRVQADLESLRAW